MLRKLGIIAVLALIVAAVVAVPAIAASPHEVNKDPIECTLNANNSVTCGGTVAGLGNVNRIIASVDVDLACATRGNENQPKGHLQGESRPITVRNGRATFSVTTNRAKCPPGLNPVVGEFATVAIFDLQGNELFSKEVRIT